MENNLEQSTKRLERLNNILLVAVITEIIIVALIIL